MKATVNDAFQSIDKTQSILLQSTDLTNKIIRGMETVQSDIVTFLERLNGLCPLVQEQICSDVLDYTTCQDAGLFHEQIVERVVQHFETLAPIEKQLNAANDIFRRIDDDLEDAKDTVGSFDWALTVVLCFTLLMAFLALLMILSLVFQKRLPRIVHCLRHWLVFPTFMGMTLISLIFMAVFISGSVRMVWLVLTRRIGVCFFWLNVWSLFTDSSNQSTSLSSSSYLLCFIAITNICMSTTRPLWRMAVMAIPTTDS